MNWFCMFFKHSNRSSQMSLIQNECEDGKKDENSMSSRQEKIVIVERVQRSSIEWVFGLLAMLLLCACAVLAAELALVISKEKSTENINVLSDNRSKLVSSPGVCVSADCLREATLIAENADFSQDPCSDFYQYSCGGYVMKTDDKNLLTATEEAQLKLHSLITSPIDVNEPTTIQKMKIFFQSCANTAQIEARGLTPARNILLQVGGWPVIAKSKWRTTLRNWQELANLYRKVNVSVNFFFEPRIAFDSGKNGLKITLGLSAANLGLSSVTDETKHEEYFQKLVDLAVLFGADKETAQQEMRYVFYFESVVKHKYWESFDLNSHRIVKMSIAQLQTLIPQVDWKDYISSFLPYSVDYSDVIFVDSPSFLPKFAHLLDETDIRILANYAAARAIWNMANLLNNDLKKITEVQINEPNQQQCIDIVLKYFSVPIGGYYLQKYLDSDAKSKTDDIVNAIRVAFFMTYDQTTWNYTLKKKMKEKIADVNTFIGYPKEMTNFKSIEKLYADLSFNTEQYFENFRKIKKNYFIRSVKQTKSGNGSTDNWIQNGGAAIALDIFYLYLTNTLYVPAIMIEEVFRVAKRPAYMNFATLGTLISKEFAKISRETHGKWDPDMETTAISCLRKQYTSENGSNVEIVDNISNYYRGLRVAFTAYQIWAQKNSIERVLPGKNLNIDKLFWLTYANGMCAKWNESLKSSDLSYLRVNLPLKNIPEFSSTFKCPYETPMNPKNKCDAW